MFTHSVRNERFRRKIGLELKHYFGRYPFTFVRPLDLNKSTLKEDDRSRSKNFRNAFAYFLCAFGIEPMRLSNYSRYFSGLSVFVRFALIVKVEGFSGLQHTRRKKTREAIAKVCGSVEVSERAERRILFTVLTRYPGKSPVLPRRPVFSQFYLRVQRSNKNTRK